MWGAAQQSKSVSLQHKMPWLQTLHEEPLLNAVPERVAAPVTEPDDGEADAAFNWRDCWYPVSFLLDIPRDKPYAFSLHDEPLVLFFNDQGEPVCLRDRCAHRAARLSDGKLVDGRIECLYHGWQYDSTGQCQRIPQLDARLAIPARVCVQRFAVQVRQGLVWIWAGDPEAADPDAIPLAKDLEAPGVFCVDFQIDLPYDQSFLIENVIDVAHIHIAHDGVRGGGLRDMARPLEFDVRENSIKGIRSGFRTQGLGPREDSPLEDAQVQFVAPNLVRFDSTYKDKSLVAGLSLYSIPSGKSRCRLLYRKYSNFVSRKERWKPRWLEHWTQCLILEQDMGVVIGQYQAIERSDQQLKQLWYPLRSSDQLVVAYRSWLDRFGSSLPYYRGYTSAKLAAHLPAAPPAATPKGRFAQHTRVCATCTATHQRTARAIPMAWGVVAVAATISLALAGTAYGVAAAFAALAAAGLATVLNAFKRRFE